MKVLNTDKKDKTNELGELNVEFAIGYKGTIPLGERWQQFKRSIAGRILMVALCLAFASYALNWIAPEFKDIFVTFVKNTIFGASP